MTLRSPAMLALLLVVPAVVAAYTQAVRRRQARADRLASEALVVTGAGAPGRRRRGHLPFVLFATALTALLLALARPEVELRIPRREGTVILAFDVSNSMRAADVEPTRLAAAKAAARAFVREQPSSIRIGVVVFGDGASIVQRPTASREEVVAAIGRLSASGGTSLGQGLFTSLSAIAGRPLSLDMAALDSEDGRVDIGYFGGAAIVVLSDSESTDDIDPMAIAQLASTAGVRVHPVGIGTEAGVVEVDGFHVATSIDEAALQAVASVTDGTYRRATDAAELREIYESIDLRVTSVPERTEVTALLTVAGALLLIAAAGVSIVSAGRVI